MDETELDQRLSRIETGIANLTFLMGARFDLLDRWLGR